MSTTLGRIISKITADAEVNKFLEIREYTYNNVNTAVAGTGGAAVNYYSDQENSFVFELSLIDTLVQELRNQGKTVNGIRVYYSAAPKPEMIGTAYRAAGSTTLVIMPVEIVTQLGQLQVIRNVISADASRVAIEYPGGCKETDLYTRVDVASDDVQPGDISYIL